MRETAREAVAALEAVRVHARAVVAAWRFDGVPSANHLLRPLTTDTYSRAAIAIVAKALRGTLRGQYVDDWQCDRRREIHEFGVLVDATLARLRSELRA